jgi:predicted dehydrogenase
MPTKVYAKMKFGQYHDIEVEDSVTVTVEYPNGALGSFITTTADTPGTNRLEITFDGGSLICEKNQLILNKLETLESVFTKENSSPYAAPKCTSTVVDTDGLNPQHAGVMNAFAAAILRNEPLVADGREGINALLLSNAMHLSAWTGKEIELPFDEQLFKQLLDERVCNSKAKENVKPVFSEFDKNHGNLCFL